MNDGTYLKIRKEEKEAYFKDLDKLREREPSWFDEYLYSYLSSYE